MEVGSTKMTDNPTDLDLIERTREFYQPEPLDILTGREPPHPVPLITERRCKVCTHADRIYIEDAVHTGVKFSRMVERLEDPTSITYWNVRDHFRNGHVKQSKEQVLDTIWKRAEEQGITPEEYAENQATHIQAVDLVVNKFLYELQDPTFMPDMKEGLAAAKLMQELQVGAEGNTYDAHDMFVTLSIFMRYVQTILMGYAPEQHHAAMDDLRRMLESDPILKVLAAKIKPEEERVTDILDVDEITEAVVVLDDTDDTQQQPQVILPFADYVDDEPDEDPDVLD